jgi:hypothetical protein
MTPTTEQIETLIEAGGFLSPTLAGPILTDYLRLRRAKVTDDVSIKKWLRMLDEVETGPEPDEAISELRDALTAAMQHHGETK